MSIARSLSTSWISINQKKYKTHSREFARKSVRESYIWFYKRYSTTLTFISQKNMITYSRNICRSTFPLQIIESSNNNGMQSV